MQNFRLGEDTRVVGSIWSQAGEVCEVSGFCDVLRVGNAHGAKSSKREEQK